MDTPPPCRWCGEPLPPRDPHRRGRPTLTHAGNCRRRDTNRRILGNRVAAFLRAHRFEADRSDYVEAAVQVYDYEDLADGFSPVPNAFGELRDRALIAAVESWEKRERIQREIQRHEWQLAEKELAQRPPVAGILDSLDPEEAEALIARAVARRRARRAE